MPEDLTPMRCRVTWGLGHLSLNCAELTNGLGLAELAQALEIAQTLGDPAMIARPLAAQGCVLTLATGQDPMPVIDQAVALARAAGDEWTLTYAQWWEAAFYVWKRNDMDSAASALAELERLGQSAASTSCLGWNDWIRGWFAWQSGRPEDSWREYERCIQRSFECNEPLMELMAVVGAVETLLDLGRYEHAETLARTTVGRARRAMDICRQGVVELSVAKAVQAHGDLNEATREAGGRRGCGPRLGAAVDHRVVAAHVRPDPPGSRGSRRGGCRVRRG